MGVFKPALERQLTPVHSTRVLSVDNVTDFGGDSVRQSELVRPLWPKLESISQLMFPDGETNSVLVEDCGTSVPDVWVVVDVVPAMELDVVDWWVVDVDVVVDVVVVDEEFDDGLLEQAARARAQAGSTSRRIDHERSALGI